MSQRKPYPSDVSEEGWAFAQAGLVGISRGGVYYRPRRCPRRYVPDALHRRVASGAAARKQAPLPLSFPFPNSRPSGSVVEACVSLVRMSLTPRVRRSWNTVIQNFVPSVFSIHEPRMSRVPSAQHAQGQRSPAGWRRLCSCAAYMLLYMAMVCPTHKIPDSLPRDLAGAEEGRSLAS